MAEPKTESYPITAVEAVTFKLAGILGGRETVLDSPTDEIFAYLDMQHQKEELQAKKEQALLWTQFLISIYSQPAREGETPEMKMQRQQFIDAIKPKGPKKEYKWSNIPPEVLEQAEKQKQIGGE